MEEAFRKSRKEMRTRLEKQRKEAKKQERKEFICFSIVFIFLIVMTVFAMIKTNEDFIDKCTSQGYTKTYCEVHS